MLALCCSFMGRWFALSPCTFRQHLVWSLDEVRSCDGTVAVVGEEGPPTWASCNEQGKREATIAQGLVPVAFTAVCRLGGNLRS